jgi:beta-barrel assembly-enhancing protease
MSKCVNAVIVGNTVETFVGHHSDAPSARRLGTVSPPLHLSQPFALKLPTRTPSARRGRASRLCASVCALALAGGALPPPAWAQNQLPSLGDAATEDFGVGAELRMGEQIMREIRRDPDYLDDPVLLDYVRSLWEPLLQRSRALGHIGTDIDQRFAWEPFLLRDRSVNAFALPGGYFGVYLGLIAITATRDELAAVLAHEMTHITQRHIARRFTNSKQQSLLGVAALILGVLAASRARSVDAANAAIVGSQAAAIQGQLNFSRDMEREADRIGFAVFASAGFAPGGMAAMFEKLDQSSRLNDSGGYPYLRSHPMTTERIGDARGRLGTAPAVAPVSGLEHGVAQARARVLMDTRVDALRRWQAQDAPMPSASATERLSAAYASALASTLLRDWVRADAALAIAQTLVRSAGNGTGNQALSVRAQRDVTLLAAQSLLERGEPLRAAGVLQPMAAEDVSRPVTLMKVQIALAAAAAAGVGNSGKGGPPDPALQNGADALQTWVAVNPQDAAAWALLGQAWARLNQPLRSLRAEAESHAAIGDLSGAADRLRAGQRRAREGGAVDFIEVSVIDARLRDIEAQRRQLEAEERAAQ